MVIWFILRSFWYIFPCFGMLFHEKSGNPGLRHYCTIAVTVVRSKIKLNGSRAQQQGLN
jgi:hypothetical protein